MIKTILELDLVGYTDIARVLEENLDVQAVKVFEDQIQSFVDIGLKSLGLLRDDIVLGMAGDNAVLVFDDASSMHRFADVVQQATREHNLQKSVDLAKRWFRMGAATGTVVVNRDERRIVGTTVANAVRLEAAADIGQLLIDHKTWMSLPDELQVLYGPEESVPGKYDETWPAHRCVLIPRDEIGRPAKGSRSSSGKRRVLGLAAASLLGCVALLAFVIFRGSGREDPGRVDQGVEPNSRTDATPDVVPQVELSGTLSVHVWDPDDANRRGINVFDDNALPIKSGDGISIQASLNRPAYLYVLWISPEGKVIPVYPWIPADWSRMKAPSEPVKEISLPKEGGPWEMMATSGMETVVLLARETPLPPHILHEDSLKGLSPQNKAYPKPIVLQRGSIRVVTTEREPLFASRSKVDDPVLKNQRLIVEQLEDYFDVVQAVSFGNSGKR